MRYLTPNNRGPTRFMHDARIVVAAALWAVLAGAGCAEQSASTDAEALTRLPHDATAFTEGLLIHDGVLFESTGNYGQSDVRRVDLVDGRILARHRLPDRYFGEGLARLGDRLYQLTWKSGTGFIYDVDTLAPRGRFHYAGQGWGLTHCGQRLVMSNGSAELRFVDPHDFRIVRRLQVTEHGRPVRHLNELEAIDGLIWANVWLTDDIVRIDPETGHVVDRIDAATLARAMPDSADVTNGIAHDAARDRIYVTGKYWPVLFRIAQPPTRTQKASAEARCQ